MKSLPLLLCALISLPGLAIARDSGSQPLPVPPEVADAGPRNVDIEVQMVGLPPALALPLLSELREAKKTEAAFAKIQELLLEGKARLIGWPMLTTKSGQRAVVESIEEHRYATEYRPAGVQVDPLAAGVDADIKVEPKFRLTGMTGVPSAFETRNIGVTLEVEPVVSPDEKTIDLVLVPQYTRLKGYHTETITTEDKQGKVTVEQPDFESHKVNTSLTVRSGEHRLLSVFKSGEKEGEVELFILKAEVKALP